MPSLSTIFSRMKWGIIPKRRIVDEDENGNFIYEKDTLATSLPAISKLIEKNKKKDYDEHTETDVESYSDSDSIQKIKYEYRDEKDRKWWKFFDEYEYRITKDEKKKIKWFKYFNDEDTPEEKRLIVKLDLLLTFYSVAVYWVKYLDQANINSAYVGGLKEGIGMTGDNLVLAQTYFSIGNAVFQLPFIYVLYGLPLNYILPSMDICWSIFTLLTYKVTNFEQFKIMRFFVGSFEAGTYISYHSLFASWYKSSNNEAIRRASCFYLGQFLGSMSSGLISGAIERTMPGYRGLQAWQWIFVIDGIISLVVGLMGFFVLPGTPTDCYSLFLTDDEIRLARKRMLKDQKHHRSRHDIFKEFFDWETWKSILTSWKIYNLIIWNMFCWNNNNGTSGAYSLWLKSLKDENGKQKYMQGKLQDLTALTPGLGLIWLTITCFLGDYFKSRWFAIIFSQIFNILGNSILAVWYVPLRLKWFAYCLQYWGWSMSPILYAWQGDICRNDIRSREFSLVLMNLIAHKSTAWVPLLVWKTTQAPRYPIGYAFTAACSGGVIVWTFIILYFYKRDEKRNAKNNGIIVYNSSVDTDIVPPEASKSEQRSKPEKDQQELI
ncbi:putative permease [Scheffersomyces coipomensis]|uniref:putative permease n=1 Tax=Scheffersomyces coipomensis TaxID=1788519 RepID=UPI00315D0E28